MSDSQPASTTSQSLLDEYNRLARLDLARKGARRQEFAAKAPSVTDARARFAELAARYGETEALRLLQIEARGAAGLSPTAAPKIAKGSTSVFDALPAHLRAAIDGGTRRDPIKRHVVHQVDIRPLPRNKLPNFDNLMPRVRAAIAKRQKGDPLPVTIETVGAVVLYFFRKQRTGFMQATYKALAATKCCIDSAFLAIRFLEVHGVLGIEGTRVREEGTGDFHRGPNMYVFRDDEPGAAPASAPDAATQAADPGQVPHWLRRYANAVQLYVRPFGLNTTPQKGVPAPA